MILPEKHFPDAQVLEERTDAVRHRLARACFLIVRSLQHSYSKFRVREQGKRGGASSGTTSGNQYIYGRHRKNL